MPSLVILLIVFLLIYSVPVFLVRRSIFARAQDYSVSCGATPPGVVQNSLIAYSLRLTVLGPLFIWGAQGDTVPAFITAVAAAFGVILLFALRRPLAAFQRAALDRDQSITVHAFIAHQLGSGRHVRILAAALTVVALTGFLVVEALALALLLKPMQLGSALSVYAIVGALLVSVPLCALPSGHSAVMQSAQAQLGALYVGLFGSSVLLLYLLLASFRPMPPHGTLAVACLAVICLSILIYRRSRYVDTGPIVIAASENAGARPEPVAGKLLRRLGKLFNPLISACLVTAIVFALMGLYSYGLPMLLRDGAAALARPIHVPWIGLFALGLLALCYPIADVTHWQRIAAIEKDEPAAVATRKTFRGITIIYATEFALLLMFVWMFGALTAVATGTVDSADIIEAFARRLASQQNFVAAGALWLLLLGVVAIAFSTMISLFSACLCTIESDLLPAARPDAADAPAPAGTATPAWRRTILPGLGLFLVIAGAFVLVEAFFPTNVTGQGLGATLIAFACCQLACVPLILGLAIGRIRGADRAVGMRWAALVPVTGAAAGMAAVIVFVGSGDAWWLWAAIPACLASGTLVFLIARLWPGKTAGRPCAEEPRTP